MMSRNSKKDSYRQARVLVTGGMGFIGSNLVIALVERGALVTVVDAQIAGCGADPRNLQSVREQIRISTDDMQDADRMAELIPEQDVIFNLAGEISHIRSITEPLRDLSINCAGQLQFLNLCRLLNPGATVIYASSRQVYGHPLYLPVDEKHPVNPVDFNGVHKHAAEQYHFLLRQQFHMHTICLRLGNIYGPRQALDQSGRGFIDVFIRASLSGEQITVFGDGKQTRSFSHVADIVGALLKLVAEPRAVGQVINIGNTQEVSIRALAERVRDLTGSQSPIKLVPYDEAYESGFEDMPRRVPDLTRIEGLIGYRPRYSLDDILTQVIEYFRKK